MTGLYPVELLKYLNIVLVFLRLLGLFIFVPGFSNKMIPLQVRLLFALSLSLAVYTTVSPFLGDIPNSISGMVGAAFFQTVVGLMMGFAAYITFEAISFGAHLMGVQLGFGAIGLLDPQSGHESSLLVSWHGWMALLLFLFIDLHHHLLGLFVSSFEVTKASSIATIAPAVFKWFAFLVGKIFWIGIQMAAPITFVILLVYVAFGILGRTLPQMNLLLFSFPVTLLLGMSVLYLIQPELLDFIEDRLGDITSDVMTVLRSL